MTENHAASATHTDGAGHHDELAHAMPWQTLVAVFAALIVLTALTVIAANLPTGSFDAWIALGIATLKATLVAAYFMHLRYDKSFHTLIFMSALLFVGLFLGLTLTDTESYQQQIQSYTESAAPADSPTGP